MGLLEGIGHPLSSFTFLIYAEELRFSHDHNPNFDLS